METVFIFGLTQESQVFTGTLFPKNVFVFGYCRLMDLFVQGTSKYYEPIIVKQFLCQKWYVYPKFK